MNVNDAFPSRYLKAADLGDAQPVLTIRDVKMEDVGKGAQKDRKPVVYFLDKEKGLVLNKTNASMIQKIVGSPDTDNWVGEKIKLKAVEVEFQGDVVNAIRVAPPKNGHIAPPAARPTSQPVETPDSDDIPF